MENANQTSDVEVPNVGMTEQERAVYTQFVSQAKRHLKSMSKNDLVKTCIALLIDNHGLKGALQQRLDQDKQAKMEQSNG